MLVFILLITRYVRGFIANISVLLGIVFGFVIAVLLGRVSFQGLADAAWLDIVMPFHFGLPTFDPLSILTLTIVQVVIFIESTGMFLALGEMVEKPVAERDVVRGLRADGLATVIGGFMNSFPHSSFSQNVGLIGVTGVRSRWVTAVGGIILIVFGLVPKMSIIVASVPQFVLGGAGVVMFGMVLATGIRILAKVDYVNNPYNAYIVAVSVVLSMIPVVSDKFFSSFRLNSAFAAQRHSFGRPVVGPAQPVPQRREGDGGGRGCALKEGAMEDKNDTAPMDRLSSLPQEEFVAALDGVYQHSPWVAASAWHKRPFKTFAGLASRVQPVRPGGGPRDAARADPGPPGAGRQGGGPRRAYRRVDPRAERGGIGPVLTRGVPAADRAEPRVRREVRLSVHHRGARPHPREHHREPRRAPAAAARCRTRRGALRQIDQIASFRLEDRVTRKSDAPRRGAVAVPRRSPPGLKLPTRTGRTCR